MTKRRQFVRESTNLSRTLIILHQSLGITFYAILRKYTENSGSRSVTPRSFPQINDRIHPQVGLLYKAKGKQHIYIIGSPEVPCSFPYSSFPPFEPGDPSRYYYIVLDMLLSFVVATHLHFSLCRKQCENMTGMRAVKKFLRDLHSLEVKENNLSIEFARPFFLYKFTRLPSLLKY